MLPPNLAIKFEILANIPGSSIISIRTLVILPSIKSFRLSMLANSLASILPPQITVPTFLPENISLFFIIAATPAAPAPSATTLSFSNKELMAFSSSNSLMSKISSTWSFIISEVIFPGLFTAMPSAKVSPKISRSFLWITLYIDGNFSVCTPNILILGFRLLAIIDIPDIKPPPPIGMTRSSKFLMSSISSKPSVPCPITTFGSSYGCIRVNFLFFTSSDTKVCDSFRVRPLSMTSAPKLFVFITFDKGACSGITIVALTRSFCAHQATACAWLPADIAITPIRFCFSCKRFIETYAPLTLKEEVYCRFSSLRKTSASIAPLRYCDRIVGVLIILPNSSLLASLIESILICIFLFKV